MADTQELPVAVIGAGPVGLAAAAHLAAKRQKFCAPTPTLIGGLGRKAAR
jgi:ribulose 1,5-bisphosphate synthetase/thiazole synthase